MQEFFITKDGYSNKKLIEVEGELTSRMWEFTEYEMKHGVPHPDYVKIQTIFNTEQTK